MPRQFHFAGKIDENTPVLGSTHGHVQKVIEAGFEEQFRLQRVKEASRATDEIYKQVRQSLEPDALKAVMSSAGAAHVVLAGGTARGMRVLAQGGLDRLLSDSVIPKVYQAALSKGFAETLVEKLAVPGARIDATVSEGHLIMRTGTDPAPAPTYRRRVGDKDVSR